MAQQDGWRRIFIYVREKGKLAVGDPGYISTAYRYGSRKVEDLAVTFERSRCGHW